MRSVLSVIASVLMLTACVFATPKRHIEGFAIPYVYPLLNAGGDPIQWIVPVFSGFYDTGGFDGPKRNPCKGAENCYWYDGNGNWRFNFTGQFACLNTCSLVGTGKLKNKLVQLPSGAFTTHLSAVLTGVFTDENGMEWQDISAFYDCDLVETNDTEELIGNTLAAGNLDIVLSLN